MRTSRYKAGDRVYVVQHNCNGMIRRVVGEKYGVLYHAETAKGTFQYFECESLELYLLPAEPVSELTPEQWFESKLK